MCDPSSAHGEIRNGKELEGKMVVCLYSDKGSIRGMVEALGPYKPKAVVVVRMGSTVGLHGFGEALPDGHPTCATLSEAKP